MPSWRAAAWARAPSRDAMPTISMQSPACMLGITRLTAIFATPNTPHRTFLMTWQLYRGGGRDRCIGAGAARYSEISCGDCWRGFWRCSGFGAAAGVLVGG